MTTNNKDRPFLSALAIGAAKVTLQAATAAVIALSAWQALYGLGWLTVLALHGPDAKDLPASPWVLSVGSNHLLLIAGIFGLVVIGVAMLMTFVSVMSLAMKGGWQPPPKLEKIWLSIRMS